MVTSNIYDNSYGWSKGTFEKAFPSAQTVLLLRWLLANVCFSKQEIDNIQKDLGPNVNLRARTVPMHPNPIQTANEVCTKLIPHQVSFKSKKSFELNRACAGLMII